MSAYRKWKTINGHVVMAISDDGLFVKNGELVTGHGTPVEISVLELFPDRADAERSKKRLQDEHGFKKTNGHFWQFVVLPVLVKEHEYPQARRGGATRWQEVSTNGKYSRNIQRLSWSSRKDSGTGLTFLGSISLAISGVLLTHGPKPTCGPSSRQKPNVASPRRH